MARGRKELAPRGGYKKEGCSGLGLPEAPVFHPTEEEFKDPLEYIARIRHLAEPYGLCRIVPPKQWDPPFALDLQSFSFPTKLQAIHQLQERSAALNPETFRLEYDRYLDAQGRDLESWPQFCGDELDLCKVYNCVRRYGGYAKVVEQKKWGEILRMVKPDVSTTALSSAAPANLSHLYERHLLEYESYRSGASAVKLEASPSRSQSQSQSQSRQDSEPLPVGRKRRSLEEEEEEHGELPLKRTRSCEEEASASTSGCGPRGCEQCKSRAHEQLMIACGLCEKAWHIYCVSPPLPEVPRGRWFCLDCVNSEQEVFGFGTGNRHTLDSFRRMCDRFKKKWFGGRPVRYSEVEEQFWEIVERSTGPVEVHYGSDLDTSVFGSGFPRESDALPKWAKAEAWLAHARSPWNLNNFPKLKGSMLRLVNENIPGVIVPWLYVGMLFSSFCWHYEDHCFYSVNYLHWGEPKCWYSVPGSAYDAFEEVMRSTFPDLFQAQPDLLFQLVTMLNPAVLRDKGVPVCTTLQEPGHFVITFPRSYHGGFNHGFNCAEAVNFAPLDWIPFGRFSIERYRFYHKAAVLSHEELLCVVAKNETSGKICSWMKNELLRIASAERKFREELWRRGLVKSSRMTPRAYKHVGKEEDAECIICRYYLHLSAVVCSCRPGNAVCLEHAEQLCECSADKKCLLYRLSLAELEDIGQQENQKIVPLQKVVNGNLVSFVELAGQWLSRARLANSTTPAVSEVEELLRQAEQFLWAGHDVDELRTLENGLASRYNWAKEVAACYNAVQERLHANKGGRLQLERVHQLVTVASLPCVEPHVSKLKAFVKDAMNTQKQIAARLSARSPEVRALQRLQQDLLRSPFDFPEAQKVNEILSSAQLWSERVQKLLSSGKERESQKAELDQLLELQRGASSLEVMVPEKRLLDVVIKKAESWQQHASELLESRSAPQEIEEALSEAVGLPVRLPQSDTLNKILCEARSWSQRAQQALNHRLNQDYGSALAALTSLVEASSCLRVQVDELDEVKRELKRYTWMKKASDALRSRSPASVLVDLLKEAEGDEDLYSKVRSTADAALSWETKAAEALKQGAPYNVFADLLSESQSIDAALAGLEDIRSAVVRADSWLPRASLVTQVCSGSSRDRVELQTLKELMSEMEGCPILLPEVQILRTCFQGVEEWSVQTSLVQQRAREILTEKSSSAQLESDEAVSRFKSELQSQLSLLQEIVSRGAPYNLSLPQFDELWSVVEALQWTLKALELLSRLASLQHLEVLVERGKAIPLVLEECYVFKVVEALRNRAKTWHSKVTSLIEDFETKVSSCLLEQLLAESQTLKINFQTEVSQLQNILADHRAWQSEVQKVFNGSASLYLPDLLALQETGEASLVHSVEVDLLESVIIGVGAWFVRCEDAVGATSQTALRESLVQLKKSADRALEIVGHRKEEFQRSCICLEPTEESDNNTLSCDKCRDRFHAPCLGVNTQFRTKTQASKQYMCPFCTAISSGAVDIINKIYSTQKPTLSALVELANSAKSLNCRVEEEDLIESILESVFSWQEWVQAVVTPMLKKDFDKVDLQVLQAALKAACVLRVQDEASGEVKRAVGIRAWRLRTRCLLGSPGKPCFRSICQAVEEAVSMGVPADDEVLQAVKCQESEASAWAERAKRVVKDGGATPLEQVNSLIATGEALSVTVTKELTELRQRSVLYCVCRTPYDDARAMIGCDRCGEWYHFSCINLPEPESNDGDCDELLRDELGPGGEFFCPACKKVGKTMLIEESGKSETYNKTRRKRSSRARQRRTKFYEEDVDFEDEEEEEEEEQEEEEHDEEEEEEEMFDESPKARPCRRTAGKHSGFDSFVMLRSR